MILIVVLVVILVIYLITVYAGKSFEEKETSAPAANSTYSTHISILFTNVTSDLSISFVTVDVDDHRHKANGTLHFVGSADLFGTKERATGECSYEPKLGHRYVSIERLCGQPRGLWCSLQQF